MRNNWKKIGRRKRYLKLVGIWEGREINTVKSREKGYFNFFFICPSSVECAPS